MQAINLSHPMFDGDIRGNVFSIPRRQALIPLIESHEVFETKWDRWDKKIGLSLLLFTIFTFSMLSLYVVAQWIHLDRGIDIGINMSYKSKNNLKVPDEFKVRIQEAQKEMGK